MQVQKRSKSLKELSTTSYAATDRRTGRPGWDPAFRTGCKLAVVDATGKVLDTVVIYPTAPQNKVEEAKKVVKALIKKYGITLISIGNGTASRESEQIVVDMLKEIKEPVQYVITNEAGRLYTQQVNLRPRNFQISM